MSSSAMACNSARSAPLRPTVTTGMASTSMVMAMGASASSGRKPLTRSMRSRRSTIASSISVPSAKVTMTMDEPSDESD